jgi:hypothetical protein
MKRSVIPFHSVVDVITNSSTVIYTQASVAAATVAKDIINELLTIIGSDKKAEDLFDIEVVPMWEDSYDFFNYERHTLPEWLPHLPRSSDYKERAKMQANYWKDNFDLIAEWAKEIGPGSANDYHTPKLSLVVKTKDGTPIKLAEKAMQLFEMEAGYDG